MEKVFKYFGMIFSIIYDYYGSMSRTITTAIIIYISFFTLVPDPYRYYFLIPLLLDIGFYCLTNERRKRNVGCSTNNHSDNFPDKRSENLSDNRSDNCSDNDCSEDLSTEDQSRHVRFNTVIGQPPDIIRNDSVDPNDDDDDLDTPRIVIETISDQE